MVSLQKLKREVNMESVIELAEIETQHDCTEKQQLHSVEEVFDRIDTKFIKFYGEYGRKIVNERRAEWNQDEIVKLKML